MMTNLLSSSVARLRFLLVMLVMMFATTEMWGAEVTFLPNELTAVTSKDYSHTKENITIAVTASTVTAEEFRIFKNQTLTISTTNDNKITGVEITCTKENTTKYGPGCFGDYDGYSYSSYVGTWSGSANSISLKASEDQVRATSIVITYSSASSGNPVAPYTVTLVPGSGSVTDTELEEESAGAGVALPTPTICEGWTFAGWAEESIDAETTDEPTLIPAGAYSPTSDITLYAVYQRTKTTDGGGGGGDYKLVTSAPTDWSGIYLIVDGSSKNCFNGSLTSLDAGGNYTSVTISDNTITSNTTTDSYSVTISKSTTNGKYYIKTASGYYIGSTASTSSDGNELKSSTSTKYDNSISISSNNVTIKGPDHILKFFYQSGQSWRFRYYKSTTTNNVRLPQLYKKSAGGSSSTTYYHSTPDCGIIEPSR